MECKDCGAPMIPGVMSAGWCSAECDLPKVKFDAGGDTGCYTDGDGETRICYDGEEYVEGWLSKEWTLKKLRDEGFINILDETKRGTSFFVNKMNDDDICFHLQKSLTKLWASNIIDAQIGCKIYMPVKFVKQKIDFKKYNYGTLP